VRFGRQGAGRGARIEQAGAAAEWARRAQARGSAIAANGRPDGCRACAIGVPSGRRARREPRPAPARSARRATATGPRSPQRPQRPAIGGRLPRSSNAQRRPPGRRPPATLPPPPAPRRPPPADPASRPPRRRPARPHLHPSLSSFTLSLPLRCWAYALMKASAGMSRTPLGASAVIVGGVGRGGPGEGRWLEWRCGRRRGCERGREGGAVGTARATARPSPGSPCRPSHSPPRAPGAR
jgi:hypothetical protein